jgi:hypothetical protein
MPSERDLVLVGLDGTWERRPLGNPNTVSLKSGINLGVHAFAPAISSNGDYYTVTNGAPTVPVWSTSKPAGETADGTATSHGSDAQALAVSNDGSAVAIADGGTIYVAGVTADPAGVGIHAVLSGNGTTSNVIFTGDSTHLLSASGSALVVWNLNQLGRIAKSENIDVPFGCSACPPPSVTVDKQVTQVAVLAAQSRVVLHGIPSDRWQASVQDPRSAQAILGYTPGNPERLAVQASDGSVSLLSAEASATVTDRRPGTSQIGRTTLGGNDQQLVSIDGGGRFSLVDPQTGRRTRTVDTALGTSYVDSVVDPSGTAIAVRRVNTDNTVTVSDIDMRTSLVRDVGRGDVENYTFSAGHLLIQRKSGAFEIWNLGGTVLQRKIQQDSSYLPTGAIAQTSPVIADNFLVQERSDRSLTVTDATSGDVLGSLGPAVTGAGHGKTGLAAAPDGSRLVAVTENLSDGANNGVLAVWDLSIDRWMSAACSSVDRDLSKDEWTQYVGSAVHQTNICGPTASGTGTKRATAPPTTPSSSSLSFSSSASSSSVRSIPAPTTPKPVQPSLAQRVAALTSQTPGQRQLLVAVPGGYQAVTWDQRGQLYFWQNPSASTSWTRIGSSTYPYSASIGAPANANATGARLTGMTNATFILTGLFTTDGAGNAVAYTTGTNGWGAIKAEANGNLAASGAPIGEDRIGLSYGFAFVGGRLETMDCSADLPVASCGPATVIRKLWAWNGRDFSRV